MKVAQGLRFEPGTIVVYDRGYNDYGLFAQWTAQRVFFVTRMKDNARYEAVGIKTFLKIGISSEMN